MKVPTRISWGFILISMVLSAVVWHPALGQTGEERDHQFYRLSTMHGEFLPENTPFFNSRDDEGDPFRFTQSYTFEFG